MGAHVIFGDINEAACQTLISNVQQENPASTGSLQSFRVDVRKYEDNLAFFQTAFEDHGRIDHAFPITGVTEGDNRFHDSLKMGIIQTPPSTPVLDINLLGALYFTRIAAVYLR